MLPSGVMLSAANELEDDADVEPFVSQDVFILGYPLGLIAHVPIPVWKRGTIATEPGIDHNSLPIIFVDSATRQGMSGSAVLARHILLGPFKKRDGSQSNTLYAVATQILGVYSGRIHPSNVEAQLGIVWKRHLVDELISSGGS